MAHEEPEERAQARRQAQQELEEFLTSHLQLLVAPSYYDEDALAGVNYPAEDAALVLRGWAIAIELTDLHIRDTDTEHWTYILRGPTTSRTQQIGLGTLISDHGRE